MKRMSINGNSIDVELVSGDGRPLDLYFHGNQYFVEARDQMEYRINVTGHSSRRLEVLTAIDGRNTLLDEPAQVINSRGMIMNGFTKYEVKGWRIDDAHTRPFIFTAIDAKTIAKQATGSTEKLGVIAIAAYREYERVARTPRLYLESVKGGLVEPLYDATRGPGMGTGMGDRLDRDKVGTTTFTRETPTNPTDIIQIYAMPMWWLKQQGIVVDSFDLPSGFEDGETGYDKFNKIK